MRISVVIASLLLISLQRQGYGETVEVPLPELTGEFDGLTGSNRSTNVNLASLPDSVRHVWIRLTGTVSSGLSRCPDVDRPRPVYLTALTLDEVTRDWWVAGAVVPKPAEIGVLSPFDVEVEFHPLSDATWETLMTGHFTVRLEAAPPVMVGLCVGVTQPRGTMTEVRLIIEGNFPSPVTPSTWGRLKSLWSE